MLERGFPVSFELGMTAIVIAVISGLVLGVIAALRRNGFLDYAAMSLAASSKETGNPRSSISFTLSDGFLIEGPKSNVMMDFK